MNESQTFTNYNTDSVLDESAKRDVFDTAKKAHQLLLDEFLTMDRDGDYRVTKYELSVYQAKDADEQKTVDFLQNQPGMQFFDIYPNEDFTPFLMSHDPDINKKVETVKNFENVFERNISKWDFNHDAFLDYREMIAAEHDPDLDADAKYMLEFVDKNFGMISNLDRFDRSAPYNFFAKGSVPYYRSGVSQDDLKELEKLVVPYNDLMDTVLERGAITGTAVAAGVSVAVGIAAVLGAPVTLPALAGYVGFSFLMGTGLNVRDAMMHVESDREKTWETLDAMDSKRLVP